MGVAQQVQSGSVRFVLVGPRAGWTGELKATPTSRVGYVFRDGVHTVGVNEVEGTRRALAQWGAFQEGSRQHDEAQKKWDEAYGSSTVQSKESSIQSPGQGSEERSSHDSSGTDATAQGDAGSNPSGDGQERTPRSMSIVDACKVLDHSKDDQWTDDGKPRIKLIQDLCRDKSIKRAEIDATGITRNK